MGAARDMIFGARARTATACWSSTASRSRASASRARSARVFVEHGVSCDDFIVSHGPQSAIGHHLGSGAAPRRRADRDRHLAEGRRIRLLRRHDADVRRRRRAGRGRRVAPARKEALEHAPRRRSARASRASRSSTASCDIFEARRLSDPAHEGRGRDARGRLLPLARPRRRARGARAADARHDGPRRARPRRRARDRAGPVPLGLRRLPPRGPRPRDRGRRRDADAVPVRPRAALRPIPPWPKGRIAGRAWAAMSSQDGLGHGRSDRGTRSPAIRRFRPRAALARTRTCSALRGDVASTSRADVHRLETDSDTASASLGSKRTSGLEHPEPPAGTSEPRTVVGSRRRAGDRSRMRRSAREHDEGSDREPRPRPGRRSRTSSSRSARYPPPPEFAAQANAQAVDLRRGLRGVLGARGARARHLVRAVHEALRVGAAVREVVPRRRSSTSPTTASTATSRPAAATRSRSTGRASPTDDRRAITYADLLREVDAHRERAQGARRARRARPSASTWAWSPRRRSRCSPARASARRTPSSSAASRPTRSRTGCTTWAARC